MQNEDKEKSINEGVCILVEDQLPSCEYLKTLLEKAFPGVNVLTFHTVRDFETWFTQRSIQSSKPTLRLALIDLGLPDGSGIEILKQLREKEPTVPAVVVTIYDDDAYLFEALSVGASGYILKAETPEDFISLLQRIKNDEPPLSPALARRLLTHFSKSFIKPKTEVELTSREKETLTLLARGNTVAETALQMGLSAQTVAGYVKIIYQKLQVSNRAEVTREAIRRGLA